MKIRFGLAFCLGAFLFTFLHGEERLIAHWDFTSGSIQSVDRQFQSQIRGSTRIVGDEAGGRYLSIGDGSKGEGILMQENYPSLTPQGGFRLEIRFRLKEGKDEKTSRVLWDNKYIFYQRKTPQPSDNHGFGIFLVPKGKELFQPVAWIGCGTQGSESFAGKIQKLQTGKIYTLTFSYDIAGQAEFKIGGEVNSRFTPALKTPLSPAVFKTAIGDRYNGNFQPLNGDIFDVKLFSIPPVFGHVDIRRRRAFVRNEKDALLEVKIANAGKMALKQPELILELPGQPAHSLSLPELSPQSERTVRIPVETRLKTGDYPASVRLNCKMDGKKQVLEKNFTLRIAPMLNDAMPVILWGYRAQETEHRIFQEIGLNCGLNYNSPCRLIINSGNKDADIEKLMRLYDNLLCDGFRTGDFFYLPGTVPFQKKYPRIGRNGKTQTPLTLNASHPDARMECAKIAEEISGAFQGHPALTAVLINSELRDLTNPSFGEYETAAFRKFSGFDIPSEIEKKSCPEYSLIKDFPFSHVIPDDYPLWVYYRWFWKGGDGWNGLNTLIHQSYKKNMKRPFLTFYDPAVRIPPIWGSGGNVDVLSHWTYAYPEPFRIGVSTAETQAMAAGSPGQRVMNMTQLFGYRSVLAPAGQKVADEPAWVKKFPDARYITMPPDLLQEAVWTQISRDVKGIMFHGIESLIPGQADHYKYTEPGTEHVLKRILHEVVQPLGPVLKRIPERKMEVAVLESFASAVFANRTTWGYAGWPFDATLSLMWANLAPGILYEETILRDGLGDLKVLVLPGCDVLPEPVFRKIKEFQKNGGIVVGDEYLVPGLTPNILFERVPRSQTNQLENKRSFQEAGLKLRRELASWHLPYTAASNPDILTWVRTWGHSDYLFVINDKRTFGNYVGQYGLVMEKGLPNSGVVSVRRNAGAVYDLVQHREVPFSVKKDLTEIPVHFSTNDGRLFLILPRAIEDIHLTVNQKAAPGKTIPYTVKICTRNGEPADALIPLQITVTDPEGAATDDSGYVAAEGGVYTGSVVPPLNTKAGKWKIEVRELASGLSAKHEF